MGVVGHKYYCYFNVCKVNYLLCRDVLFGILFLDKYIHVRFRRFSAAGHQMHCQISICILLKLHFTVLSTLDLTQEKR